MTVPIELASWGPYTGNDVTTNFAYTGRIFHETDLVVKKQLIATGVETLLVLNTDYTVTGVDDLIGGHVILNAPLPSTYTLTIDRIVSMAQLTDIKNQGAFNAEIHEDAFDRLAMVDQQLDARVPNMPFPIPGQYLMWGSPASARQLINDSGIPTAPQFFTGPWIDAIQRTVTAKLAEVFSPDDFGAVGDGVADDTAELQALGAAVQANGGGRVLFPKNKTYKIYSAGQPISTAMFNFIGLRGVEVDFNGSKFVVYHDFTGTGLILFLIIVDNCKFVRMINGEVVQNIPVTLPGGAVEGVTGIIVQRGCEYMHFDGIALDGGIVPLQFQRNTTTENLTAISTKAVCRVHSQNSFYGFSCADSGNDLEVRVTTRNVFRSYFIYGCNNHRAEVVSTNARSNDCLIVGAVTNSGTPTLHTENISLRYNVMGRTVGTGVSYLTLGQPNNISNCVLRGIHAEIHMDYTGESTLPTAVTIIKAGAGGQNFLMEDIKVFGSIRNVPNIGGDLIKIFDTAYNPWSSEVADNFQIGPLKVSGSSTPSFGMNLHPFSGNDRTIRLVDISFPGPSNWTNLGAGNLIQSNVTLSDRRSRDVFVVFTPTWTAAGGGAAIGNGVLTGTIRRYGKMATVTIRMTPGSTTTFGTGAWEFGIPSGVAPYIDDLLGVLAIGSAYAIDTGVAFHIGAVVSKADLTAKFFIVHEGGVAQWQSTIPHAWANGDDMVFSITFSHNQ